jgi:hypothetical protein
MRSKQRLPLLAKLLRREYVILSVCDSQGVERHRATVRAYRRDGVWLVNAPGWGWDSLDQTGVLSSWSPANKNRPSNAAICWEPLTPKVREFYESGD